MSRMRPRRSANAPSPSPSWALERIIAFQFSRSISPTLELILEDHKPYLARSQIAGRGRWAGRHHQPLNLEVIKVVME